MPSTVAAAAAAESHRFVFRWSRCPFCKKAKQLVEDLLANPADYEASKRVLPVLVFTRSRFHLSRIAVIAFVAVFMFLCWFLLLCALVVTPPSW